MTNVLQKIKGWITNRVKERTTWDGIILIVAGMTYIVFKPIAVIIAYAAILYGIWTVIKQEQK